MNMNKTFVKLAALVAVLPIIVAIVLGVFYLLWCAWCWVLPQIYPSGPENLIKPSYWLFVVAWVLASWVGRAIFGGKK